MNAKFIVKISNTIGLISILILLYWTFTFISIEVFGFKVFRENITETFYLSILGILGLMCGALITNIMFNMTRIAEKHNNDALEKQISYKPLLIIIGLSFPLLFSFLYYKDFATMKKKEKLMLETASSIVGKNSDISAYIANYSFTENYINHTSDYLEILQKTDKNFPYTTVIIADSIGTSVAYLEINSYNSCNMQDTLLPDKLNYLKATSKVERDYLYGVFYNEKNGYKYSSHDGNYELFYPFRQGKKVVVFYFSSYNRYGK